MNFLRYQEETKQTESYNWMAGPLQRAQKLNWCPVLEDCSVADLSQGERFIEVFAFKLKCLLEIVGKSS